VQHPNVAPTLDVVAQGNELLLVMEYIRGESLGALLKATRDAGTTVPIPMVTAITIGFLSGLQVAHEATDERGHPLAIVHRDVSPESVLVGTDGVARVLDFGVAKAATRLQTTREGRLKGKRACMAPEQVSGKVSQRTDVYSAGVVLWETLACRRLFRGETEAQLLRKVLEAT
jgi:serine/threonine protein kinase